MFRHENLPAFLSAPTLAEGVHAVWTGDVPVDFLLRPMQSNTLLVIFGAAAPRGPGNTPPFFSGLGLANGLDCSVMAINDPCFYTDKTIRIGWYVGNSKLPLQVILPAIIEKVAGAIGAERVIMAGGSAGGFASLYYATKVHAIAVAFNPQTNIALYERTNVERLARVSFGWEGGGVEDALSPITFDLVSHYASVRTPPPVIYMQNASDWHATTHAAPFLERYGLAWTGSSLSADGIYVHVGDWGAGHTAPPKELTAHVLSQLLKHQGTWDEAILNAAGLFADFAAPSTSEAVGGSGEVGGGIDSQRAEKRASGQFRGF